MIQIILMLLGLAFGQNNANTSCNNNGNNNNNGQPTTQLADPGIGTDPGDGVDPDGPGNGGSTGGNTGQTPPPFTNP
ncbi:hypothetical protein [Chryseobacterium gambrini]|uniref:Uncharacterized protein n=1 Tax=Chryseobacterium gambrini TaxID=373672 RepID=A0A1N7MDL8_9FLAO|nr:hypothetical protein [Chryseobacterium gambrini]SIS84285.1 hypothetical protein SAMN05421785_103152 [Chryseobacterium gambrini]